MRSRSNKNGVLIRMLPHVQYYTPKEWYEALFDINEIIQTETFYAESFLFVAFVIFKFRKKKKYYEKECIRLHRKKVCQIIAPNPEIKIYEGEQLEDFKKQLQDAVFETFDYQTRSASFRLIKIRGRCLNCSLILSETDRNSYRYCSEDCRDLFYLDYNFKYSRDYVWQRDNRICQICKKSTRYIEENSHDLFYIDETTNKPVTDKIDLMYIEDKRIIKYKKGKNQSGEIFDLPYYIKIREYDSYQIDHIKEVSTGETAKEQVKLFLDYNNMQTVCISCHKKKTGDFLRKKFSKKIQAQIKAKVKVKKIKDFI